MALQGTPERSRRSPARLRQPSWGFPPLQRHQHGGLLNPGFQPRYVPPPGFPTLMTVSSLRASRPRGPVPLMGFTLQSFSPSQSCTPFDADALLPFLTSHPSALRTRRSRCPATPGLCSLRRSVPSRSRSSRQADALLGFDAPPANPSPVTVEADHRRSGSPPRSRSRTEADPEGPDPGRSRNTGRPGRPGLAARPARRRYSTRTRPQLLLKAMWSCRLPDRK
jgi:hypothetical protein